MAKVILVTGATGKQGGSVINQLANNPAFTLLAVTRSATGSGAQKLLAKGKNIKIVEGDQNDCPTLFANAAKVAGSGRPVWGVYSVQISQGRGVTHEGEIRQGTGMIDAAFKAGVKHFVYGSVDRGGDGLSWDHETPIPHFQSKHHIEHYLRYHAGSMGWTVLRPVAFMDNLAPGFQTQVFMAAMRDALKDKPCQWVAVRDIGVFAKLAFETPAKYNHKAIGLAGDELNPKQVSDIVKKHTGQPLDGAYWIFGSVLRFMVPELRVMIDWFASDGYKVKIAECKKMNPDMLTLEGWLETQSSFAKADL